MFWLLTQLSLKRTSKSDSITRSLRKFNSCLKAEMNPGAPALRDQSLFKQAAFINGKWLNAQSGKTFEVYDPASGNVIGSMPDMDASETESAIHAAAGALPKFRRMVARDRSHILHRWYELLEENADDLAKLITWENGKPLFEALSEVKYAAHYFEWFSGEATRLDGETIPASVNGHRIYTIKDPVGVVGLITPWNWPIGMVTRKVGPVRRAPTQGGHLFRMLTNLPSSN